MKLTFRHNGKVMVSASWLRSRLSELKVQSNAAEWVGYNRGLNDVLMILKKECANCKKSAIRTTGTVGAVSTSLNSDQQPASTEPTK